MSLQSIWAAFYQYIKHMWLNHPFFVIFFSVLTVFTILSVTLITVVAGDPDIQAFSPLDEERRIFLPPDSDALRSPSSDSENSDAASHHEFAVLRESKVSDATVESLLAAHRNHVEGRLSGEILSGGTHFSLDPHDVQWTEEENESGDEDPRFALSEQVLTGRRDH